ncbi:hypothetical protein [Plastoroseomonas hellenica]|nr:hypothetical protein [Plastoroseomonas hellenica]
MREFLIKLSVCAALISGVVALSSALASNAADIRAFQIASFD